MTNYKKKNLVKAVGLSSLMLGLSFNLFAQSRVESTILLDHQADQEARYAQTGKVSGSMLKMRSGVEFTDNEYHIVVGLNQRGNYSKETESYYLITGKLNINVNNDSSDSNYVPSASLHITPLATQIAGKGDFIADLGILPFDYNSQTSMDIEHDARLRVIKANVAAKKNIAFIEAAVDAFGVQWLKHKMDKGTDELDQSYDPDNRFVEDTQKIPGKPLTYLFGGQLALGVKLFDLKKDPLSIKIVPFGMNGHVAEGNRSIDIWSEISVAFKNKGNIILRQGKRTDTYYTQSDNRVIHSPTERYGWLIGELKF